MAKKHRSDPPWKWIDDLVTEAKRALTLAGVYADNKDDLRSVRVNCPLCRGIGTITARWSGKRRRVRIICDNYPCVNFVEELRP